MTLPAHDPRYPLGEVDASGLLDLGDGDRIWWEASGARDGTPAVVLHGGPGGGCSPGARRFFDPAAYRLIQVDQRGCGRSLPNVADPTVSLARNETGQLVADLEQLRAHLGVERWLLYGGSWGSTLALAYAQRHPERVRAAVIILPTTGRRAETDLLTRGLGMIFPEAYARFLAGVPEAERDGDLAAAYARLLDSPDPAVRERAARDWCDWEAAIVPSSPPYRGFADPDFRMTFARLVTHYWSNGCFVDDDELLRGARRLAGIPCTLIAGSLDLGNLAGTPWLLHEAWPGSELVIVDDAGHDAVNGGMPGAIVRATDRYRGIA